MKFKLARKSGFCFGVKRAMNMAWDEVKSKSDSIYALGPIIHNKQAVQKYEEEGLITVDKIDSVNANNYMIIRSHGVPQSIYDEAKSKEINIVDTTCPFVKKIHNIVKDYNEKGYKVIVIGDKTHPEVIGINGWCDNSAEIIKTIDDLNNLQIDNTKKYCVVAQTTINLELYNKIIERLSLDTKDIVFNNTICSATKERQEAARELSKEVNSMIVVGGKHSSNTQKLVQICAETVPTFAIETVEDINVEELKKYDMVGITAGASTPDWIINDVVDFVKGL